MRTAEHTPDRASRCTSSYPARDLLTLRKRQTPIRPTPGTSAGSPPSSASTYSPSASARQAAGRSRPRSPPPPAAPRSHPSHPRPDSDPSASPHLISFVSDVADSPGWCGDSLRPPTVRGLLAEIGSDLLVAKGAHLHRVDREARCRVASAVLLSRGDGGRCLQASRKHRHSSSRGSRVHEPRRGSPGWPGTRPVRNWRRAGRSRVSRCGPALLSRSVRIRGCRGCRSGFGNGCLDERAPKATKQQLRGWCVKPTLTLGFGRRSACVRCAGDYQLTVGPVGRVVRRYRVYELDADRAAS